MKQRTRTRRELEKMFLACRKKGKKNTDEGQEHLFLFLSLSVKGTSLRFELLLGCMAIERNISISEEQRDAVLYSLCLYLHYVLPLFSLAFCLPAI